MPFKKNLRLVSTKEFKKGRTLAISLTRKPYKHKKTILSYVKFNSAGIMFETPFQISDAV